MRKAILIVLTALSLLGGLAVPSGPLEAQSKLDECIEGCNEDFPNDTPYLIAIRGWCYIIRCGLLS